eukprot:COSAG06_NODE_56147_length_286_cov_0.812834_1_plen_41_part_10
MADGGMHARDALLAIGGAGRGWHSSGEPTHYGRFGFRPPPT